ncbi:MAG TPA: DHA2 family efflux MFS transporter permease subunit [Anaerolineae bacterium]
MSSLPSQSTPALQGRIEYKWKVLLTVIFGIFMVILDTTVVNVAFQTLRQEFGATLNDSQWIISIYVLSLGISTPLSGYLADRFGIKRVYLGGLLIFVIGSLLCGIAPNLWFLIAARALQGFGGGVALPLSIALLISSFPVAEQGAALGFFGIAALSAPAIGPILGGWLVDQNVWRFIFFINPPIGIIGVLLGSRLLRERKSERKPSFDILGLITEIIGFGSLLYGASLAANGDWTSPSVLTWFAIGAVGLIAFAIVELYIAKEPLLDLRLFQKRTFLNASLLGYVSVIALFGAEFLLPVYLQALRGRTALETGIILLPMAITGAIFSVIAGRLYDRLGPRPLVAVGFGILIINTWQLSQLQADTAISWIVFLLVLRGVALGLTVQTTLITALSVVPMRHLARGSSLSNATRNVVQSVGVALLATVLASTLSPQVQALQTQLLSNPSKVGAPPVAICESSNTTFASASGSAAGGSAQLPSNAFALVARACAESVQGFERAYTVTFYAALMALVLGLLLPGWPLKWAGRRAADAPQVAGH